MKNQVSHFSAHDGIMSFITVSKAGNPMEPFRTGDAALRHQEYVVENGDILNIKIGICNGKVAATDYASRVTCEVLMESNTTHPVSAIWTSSGYSYTDGIVLRASTPFTMSLVGEIILGIGNIEESFPSSCLVLTRKKLVISYQNPGGVPYTYMMFQLRVESKR